MTHTSLAAASVAASLVVSLLASIGPASAAPGQAAAPSALARYADYIALVTTSRSTAPAERTLAIAREDPSGTRCFAAARSRTERELCQRFLQEKALVESIPAIAIATRAKQILDADPAEPSRADLVPFAQACVDAADRLAETGIAPLRKIGPYTIGLVKSKLCNALLVAAAEPVAAGERVSATDR